LNASLGNFKCPFSLPAIILQLILESLASKPEFLHLADCEFLGVSTPCLIQLCSSFAHALCLAHYRIPSGICSANGASRLGTVLQAAAKS
jgi:hypothetical protein